MCFGALILVPLGFHLVVDQSWFNYNQFRLNPLS